MSKLSDNEILARVDAEFESSLGAPGGEISKERALAWDYYLSKPLGNEVEGESQIVTSDVSDVVDGIMPSIMRLFSTQENLVSFDAVGPEDEEGAEQESDYVNHVFFKKNHGFNIIYTWTFDALLQKNGTVKAYWDDSEKITEESYEGLTEFELAQLLEDEELEAVEQESRVETIPTEQGPIEATVYDVKFKRTSKGGCVRVENVPPEERRVSSDARSIDSSGARMNGQEREVTRSELIEMGFDKELVMSLAASKDKLNSNERISRNDRTDDLYEGSPDESQERVLFREAHILLDINGDGKSELRQIMTAGGKVLSNEPSERSPFHDISPQPLPHKHHGRATAEKVMDVQKVGTTLLRQTLQNLYHTNKPGHGVWEQGIGENTIDDLMTTQVGRIARFARPVNESYQPLTVPFTAGASFPMLEYFDKVKRDRTGVNADSEGLSPEQLKNIQSGVMSQANDLSRMKIELIARIFAETGFKSLFLHIHELLQKHQKKADIVRLRNRWVQVDPQAWRNRADMTVNIGLGIGSRDSNLIHLNNIWEKQSQLLDRGMGGLVVTPDNIFNTASEMVKNANMKLPEMFFSNPQGQPMPQAGSEGSELEQMQIQLQQRQQEIDAQKQQNKELEMMLKKQKDDAELIEKRAKREDDTAIAMEQIMTKLTELELKFNTDVPGAAI